MWIDKKRKNSNGEVMNKFFGSFVEVYLKNSDVMMGMFYDSDDECVYLQQGDGASIAIPKDNVRYYLRPPMSDKVDNGNTMCDIGKVPANNCESGLEVYVDNKFIDFIHVPLDYDISSCNKKTIELLASSNKVKEVLRGRIQKTMHYDMGKVHIITENVYADEVVEEGGNEGFVMNSPMTNSFLNPSDLVERLNNVKKAKK